MATHTTLQIEGAETGKHEQDGLARQPQLLHRRDSPKPEGEAVSMQGGPRLNVLTGLCTRTHQDTQVQMRKFQFTQSTT